jgi:hypothetical protein
MNPLNTNTLKGKAKLIFSVDIEDAINIPHRTPFPANLSPTPF